MHEVLVNRLGGLSLPRKSVVRLTDHHRDMTLDVYHGRKTIIQQQQQQSRNPKLIKINLLRILHVYVWDANNNLPLFVHLIYRLIVHFHLIICIFSLFSYIF